MSGSAKWMSSRPRTSAPTPFGPPILCAESVSRSAPSAPISQAMRPAACTASTCRRPPAACTIAAASATGWITPVSLLASMSETSGRDRLAHSASRKRRKIDRRRASTGMSSIASRGNRPPARTEGCSIADINSRSRGRFSSRGLDRRRQRQRVGFGAARGEDHVRRLARRQAAPPLPAPVRSSAAPPGPRHAPRTGCRSAPARRAKPSRASARSGAVAFQSK